MGELGGDPGAATLGERLAHLFRGGDRVIGRAANHSPRLEQLLYHFSLSTRGIFLMGVCLLLLLILPLIGFSLRRMRCVAVNFRGDTVLQSYGIAILLPAAGMLTATWLFYPGIRASCITWLVTLFVFGGLGLADDLFGNKDIKGLRGHFRSALKEHTLTTGFLKAVGGAGAAFWAGWRLYPEDLASAIFAALLIALAANTINLMDLRPGRAGAVFLVGSFLALLDAATNKALKHGVPLLIFVLLPTFPAWQRDAAGRVMLGDAGSNLLGASLGLAIAQEGSLPMKCIALAVFFGLNILAERASVTALIEKFPVLRALDRLTGVR